MLDECCLLIKYGKYNSLHAALCIMGLCYEVIVVSADACETRPVCVVGTFLLIYLLLLFLFVFTCRIFWCSGYLQTCASQNVMQREVYP